MLLGGQRGGGDVMKITAIETIRPEEFANLLFLRVHTDEGLVGLGETFFAQPPWKPMSTR
jgi:L-alanine-DL-glutamate epimerase-like enolase superfamily enzyme